MSYQLLVELCDKPIKVLLTASVAKPATS